MDKEQQDFTKQTAQSPVETERTRNRRVYVPKVDIYETKDAIVLLADMPGVDENTVDITLEKNALTLKGTVEPVQFKDHSIAYAEYDTGDYERAFTISDAVDRDRIEAAVHNGVLKVTLYKAEPVKARKIAIKSA